MVRTFKPVVTPETNVTKVSGTTQTARDWSLDFKKLTDGIDITDRAARDMGKIDIAGFDVSLPAGTNNIGDVDVISRAMAARNIPSGATIYILDLYASTGEIMRTIPTGKTFYICYASCSHDGTNYGQVMVRDTADAGVATLAMQHSSTDIRIVGGDITPAYEVPAGYDIYGRGHALVIGYEV